MSAGAIASPFLKQLFSQIGVGLVGKGLNELFGGGESDYQKSLGRLQGVGEPLLQQLQKEARGVPSVATENAMGRLGEEINRMQQSYSASMTSANPMAKTTTTPMREGQKGYQEAKIRGMADIMGTAQQNAQGTLANLFQGGQYYQLLNEMQKRKDDRETYQSVYTIWNKMKAMKDDQEFMETFMPYLKKLVGLITGNLYEGMGESGGTEAPASEGNVWNFEPNPINRMI